MGKLGGFSYREVIEELNRTVAMKCKGYERGLFTTVPHQKEIKEGTLQAILKQCKIAPKVFLEI